jgi:hypothetical protein
MNYIKQDGIVVKRLTSIREVPDWISTGNQLFSEAFRVGNGQYIKIGHGRFLSYPSSFNILAYMILALKRNAPFLEALLDRPP